MKLRSEVMVFSWLGPHLVKMRLESIFVENIFFPKHNQNTTTPTNPHGNAR